MASPTAPTDYPDRVEWLIDREEIRALIGEFGRSVDDKDQAAYASTFAEDGEVVLPFGTFSGRAAIAEMKGPPPNVSTQHLISTTIIDVTGDTATGRSYLTATHAFNPDDNTQKAHSGGWYDQSFVRTAEGWRFSRIELVIVWADPRPMIPGGPQPGGPAAGGPKPA